MGVATLLKHGIASKHVDSIRVIFAIIGVFVCLVYAAKWIGEWLRDRPYLKDYELTEEEYRAGKYRRDDGTLGTRKELLERIRNNEFAYLRYPPETLLDIPEFAMSGQRELAECWKNPFRDFAFLSDETVQRRRALATRLKGRA